MIWFDLMIQDWKLQNQTHKIVTIIAKLLLSIYHQYELNHSSVSATFICVYRQTDTRWMLYGASYGRTDVDSTWIYNPAGWTYPSAACCKLFRPHLSVYADGRTDRRLKRSRVWISAIPLSGNNLGQVVHTCVPLSPNSIIWYRSRGGDALRLGR